MSVPWTTPIRSWHGGGSAGPWTPDVRFGLTLEQVRSQLPDGMTRMERFPEDEPQIVEVWL